MKRKLTVCRSLSLTVGLVVLLTLPAGTESAPRFSSDVYRFLDWTVPHRIEQAVVQYVYDGDTLQDRSARRIRLLGLNAPEVAHPEHDKFKNDPGGLEAMRFTEKMVRGKYVYLIIDGENSTDRFERTLALVFVRSDLGKWVCLNWELVRHGLAEVMIFPDNRLCVAPLWRELGEVSRRARVDDFHVLALSLEEEDRHEEAVHLYQNGIRRFPDARDLYEDLGQLYFGMNLPGFSVDIYRAYLERHPGDSVVRYHLARTYEEMAEAVVWGGDPYRQRARDEWQRLLKTDFEEEARKAMVRLDSR